MTPHHPLPFNPNAIHPFPSPYHPPPQRLPGLPSLITIEPTYQHNNIVPSPLPPSDFDTTTLSLSVFPPPTLPTNETLLRYILATLHNECYCPACHKTAT